MSTSSRKMKECLSSIGKWDRLWWQTSCKKGELDYYILSVLALVQMNAYRTLPVRLMHKGYILLQYMKAFQRYSKVIHLFVYTEKLTCVHTLHHGVNPTTNTLRHAMRIINTIYVSSSYTYIINVFKFLDLINLYVNTWSNIPSLNPLTDRKKRSI